MIDGRSRWTIAGALAIGLGSTIGPLVAPTPTPDPAAGIVGTWVYDRATPLAPENEKAAMGMRKINVEYVFAGHS